MIMRMLLVVALSLFVCGCTPAKKENVVMPKKNENSAGVESQKGNGEERELARPGGPAKDNSKK